MAWFDPKVWCSSLWLYGHCLKCFFVFVCWHCEVEWAVKVPGQWGTFTAQFECAHAKLSHSLGNRLLLSTENITTLHLDFPLADSNLFFSSMVKITYVMNFITIIVSSSLFLREMRWNGHDWTHFSFLLPCLVKMLFPSDPSGCVNMNIVLLHIHYKSLLSSTPTAI